MLGDFLSWRIVNLPGFWTVSLILVTALWCRYAFQHGSFSAKNARGTPPTFPYVIPLLGSLPITYLWSPMAFVLNPNNFFQSDKPVRVKVLHYEFYILRGQEDIKAMFKNSRICTSIPFLKFALSYAFGLSAQASTAFDRDDSGGGSVPYPDSKVEARNRIDWRVFHATASFLEGIGLWPLCQRFVDDITQRLHDLADRHGDGWTYHADLIKVVGDEVSTSIVNAFCGRHLMRLNPDFLQDFWTFDRNVQIYLQGIPWFFAPRAHAARKRAINAVELWQQYARDNFDPSAIDSNGDDPFWGSSYFRNRQEMFSEIDDIDHAAIASQDFGALWASRNAVSATFWAVFDIYRDPELLATVRAEVASCESKETAEDDRIHFDMEKLIRLPVLQAVYAETLRLRMHFYIIRMADKVDMPIRDWIIPRRKVIVASTTVAHMNTKLWSTGPQNEHDIDKFWVGRFLEYPPQSSAEARNDTKQSHGAATPATTPKFTMEGRETSWLPYGGGSRQCPGRHFAKRQILFSIALMVSLFDCEILEDGKDLQGDHSLMGFGSGMSHPAGKVPVRIRRRSGNRTMA